MTRRRGRQWWLVFGMCTLFVLAAMVAMSMVMLSLEAESAAVQNRESAMRVALWRMDSFLAPNLAREAARPHYEYVPFFETNTTYTRMYSEIQPGSVLAPSPLLTLQSDYFPIHFQVDPDGVVSSPQVPEGNELDLAEASLLPPGEIDRRRALLEGVRAAIDPTAIALACSLAEARMQAGAPAASELPSQQFDGGQQAQQAGSFSAESEQARSLLEKQKRAEYNWNAQTVMESGLSKGGMVDTTEASQVVSAGPLVPVWAAGQSTDVPPQLFFIRRVNMQGSEVFQGFVADWSVLRPALLEQVADLFVESDLIAVTDALDDGDRSEAHMLAAIPAVLEGMIAGTEVLPLFTPARIALAVTWLAVLGAIVAAGLTLRASIDFGERRSRFASAVTHELRTPLTTFELYAGMLADGMVTDPARAGEYHATLRDEAERLSAIVENVLAYAQVEEGRLARTPQRATLGEAVNRALPTLQRRAERCGATIDVTIDDPADRPWLLDIETISQILFNLVDNACKYGRPGSAGDAPASRIELVVRASEGSAEFEVMDSGPGVPDSIARRIFEPFDRGAIAPGAPTPGVGIGLTLSRELARAMGGDLTLRSRRGGQGAGACFSLRLPLRA